MAKLSKAAKARPLQVKQFAFLSALTLKGRTRA